MNSLFDHDGASKGRRCMGLVELSEGVFAPRHDATVRFDRDSQRFACVQCS